MKTYRAHDYRYNRDMNLDETGIKSMTGNLEQQKAASVVEINLFRSSIPEFQKALVSITSMPELGIAQDALKNFLVTKIDFLKEELFEAHKVHSKVYQTLESLNKAREEFF